MHVDLFLLPEKIQEQVNQVEKKNKPRGRNPSRDGNCFMFYQRNDIKCFY